MLAKVTSAVLFRVMENVYLGFANESGLKYLIPESESDWDRVMRRTSSFSDCIAFWSVLDFEAFTKVRKLFAENRVEAWYFLQANASRFGLLC